MLKYEANTDNFYLDQQTCNEYTNLREMYGKKYKVSIKQCLQFLK